jgi:hypothetical protein
MRCRFARIGIMRRRLFTVLSALSLAICLAAMLLWGFAQQFTGVHLTHRWEDHQYRIVYALRAWGWTRNEVFFCTWSKYIEADPPTGLAPIRQDLERWMGDPGRTVTEWRQTLPSYSPTYPNGHQWGYGTTNQDFEQYRFSMISLLYGLLPAAWLGEYVYRRWRASREPRIGHCRVCGYDLRATPDRCPECGAVAKAERSRST